MFWTWEWLTRLLVWVPVLLVGFDVLVMMGYYFLLFASSMSENPT